MGLLSAVSIDCLTKLVLSNSLTLNEHFSNLSDCDGFLCFVGFFPNIVVFFYVLFVNILEIFII